jgi:hypothetical protein
MGERYTAAQIKEICNQRDGKKITFLIPVETETSIFTFRASYRHEYSGYVAEPGILKDGTWTPIVITASETIIAQLKEQFLDTYGIEHVTCTKLSNQPTIIDRLFTPTPIKR